MTDSFNVTDSFSVFLRETYLKNVYDYTPVLSTLSNLIDLFHKCVSLPFSSTEAINNSRYYTHLNNKPALRCIVLLIPVVGNLVVAMYDFANRQYDNKQFMLGAIERGDFTFFNASLRLRNDPDFVWEVYQKCEDQMGSLILRDLSPQLKDNKKFILQLVSANGLNLQFASENLKNNQQVVTAAVKNRYSAFVYASEALKNNPGFVVLAVVNLKNKMGSPFRFATEAVRNNRGVVQTVVSNNGLELEFAGSDLKKDKDIVLLAVKENGLALQFANEALQDDEDVVLAAYKKDMFSVKYARENAVRAILNKGYRQAFQYANEAVKKKISEQAV